MKHSNWKLSPDHVECVVVYVSAYVQMYYICACVCMNVRDCVIACVHL